MTGGRKKRFLAPEVLEAGAREVSDLAREEGAHAALCGGYALQLYGSPRLTGDVDVVVDRSIAALPSGTPLSFGGYQTETPSGVPVDLILRSDDYERLYDEALHTAQRVEGAALPVVRPEYLVAMKMVAGRGRDSADFDWLVTEGDVDMRRVRRIVREHLGPYAVGELDRLVEQARWEANRERAVRGGKGSQGGGDGDD